MQSPGFKKWSVVGFGILCTPHFTTLYFCFESQDEFEPGDLVVADNLACHNNLRTRRFFFKNRINHLPLPPKVATTRSPLDNCLFAVWKAR